MVGVTTGWWGREGLGSRVMASGYGGRTKSRLYEVHVSPGEGRSLGDSAADGCRSRGGAGCFSAVNE